MKNPKMFIRVLCATSLLIGSVVFAADPALIKMKVESVNHAAHWMQMNAADKPTSEVKVTEGDKVVFEVTYDLKGGYANHDFSIPALKIHKQIDRDKTVSIPATIDLKPGKYEIRCQFHHPKHVDGTLVVAPKTAAKAGE